MESSALRHYWFAYGGLRALVCSPYLYGAILLTAASWKLWIKKSNVPVVSQIIFDIVPSMLGFSIGAMAILLAFSESRIFKILAQDGNEKSGYIDLSSKFIHFILVQVIAIFFGVFLRAYGGKILAGFAVFWMSYALLTGIAIALALFGMAQIYNAIARYEKVPGKDLPSAGDGQAPQSARPAQ